MASIGTGNRRTLVFAAVGLLIVAAAGGWYLYGDELLGMLEGSPPPQVARAPVRRPARPPVKPAAAKPAPGKPAPGTPAAAQAAAGKPAPAAKPTPPPAPLDPDAAVAEVMKLGGVDRFATQLRDGALQGMEAAPNRPADLTPESAQAYRDAINRVLAPDRIQAKLRKRIRSVYDPARFASFIALLKQPINEKMTKFESETPSADQVKHYFETLRRKPLAPARQALIRRIDTAGKASERSADVSVVVIRALLESGITAPGAAKETPVKAGGAPAAMAAVEREIAPIHDAVVMQNRAVLAYTYRAASDADLKQYAALLESDAGRWGMNMLSGSIKSVIGDATSELADEIKRVAADQRNLKEAEAKKEKERAAAEAREMKAEAADEAADKRADEKAEHAATARTDSTSESPAEDEAAAAARAAARAKAAAEAEAKRRAALPELYDRYNDLVTAVTMQDRRAVTELLDDGKDPNVRASSGRTALMIAVQLKDADIARLLLLRGANPNLRTTDGTSALRLAKEGKSTALESLLRSYGATP